MEGERPAQAGVQYNDVAGEVAADVSDRLGNSLQRVAKELGFTGHGHVVGIGFYGGDESPASKPELVSVSFQVTEGPWGVDKLNEALAESGGVLEVKEYHRSDVPVVEFVGCFNRLDIGLFSSHIKAKTIVVTDHINLDEAGD